MVEDVASGDQSQTINQGTESYSDKLEAEARHWQDHLKSEQAHAIQAWLDHPAILKSYLEKRQIDGQDWPFWLQKHFNGPADRALDLGCGSGSRGIELAQISAANNVVGWDVSEGRLAEARVAAARVGVNATFECVDVNTVVFEPQSFDLIISCHSFHHFWNLEHLMTEIAKALRPNGLFILEEFVGPSIFQWTDHQVQIVEDFLAILPADYKALPVQVPHQATTKTAQWRPTVEEVQNASPFEAIRSGEILSLFRKHFHVLHEKPLGGTIQHLLYDGIIHNFGQSDSTSAAILTAVDHLESKLIQSGAIPSDFMLLVGSRKGDGSIS